MLGFVFGRIGGENGKRRQGDEADGEPADKQVSGHCKAFKKQNAIIASRTHLV